ncbi:MAG: ABC transporter permease subunit [Actinobacteria bacterium]|nr:ABC transporter permease subunit [Actinomycetota bacterium]
MEGRTLDGAIVMVGSPAQRAIRSLRRPRNGWTSAPGFLLAWIVLTGGWELGAASGVLNAAILPPPSDFVPYLLNGATAGIGPAQVSFTDAIADTLVRVTLGFALGVFAATAVGIFLASTRAARLVGLPIVQTIAPIAPVAWIPLAIAVVGTGDDAAVFVVFMGIFATMCLATIAALAGVPEELVKAARTVGARGWRLWLRVIVPAAAPALATAVRLSFFTAWMAVLAGEMAGINSGLGALVILGQQQFAMELVMAGLVAIGVLGFAIDRLLLVARRRVLWWETRGPAAGRRAHV